MPSNPTPANGAGPLLPSQLTWSAAAGAEWYEVAFSTTNPPTGATRVLTPGFPVDGLAAGASYYWRVTAGNAAGTTASPVWSFTTRQ